MKMTMDDVGYVWIQFKNDVLYHVVEENKDIIFRANVDYIARKLDKTYMIDQTGYEFEIAGVDEDLWEEYRF